MDHRHFFGRAIAGGVTSLRGLEGRQTSYYDGSPMSQRKRCHRFLPATESGRSTVLFILNPRVRLAISSTETINEHELMKQSEQRTGGENWNLGWPVALLLCFSTSALL